MTGKNKRSGRFGKDTPYKFERALGVGFCS